jgi:hypothetical protein
MDEEVFNLELRKFLKHFGVTAQREVEKAVDAALQRGALARVGVLPVRATLAIPGVLPELHIDGEIALTGTLSPPAGWRPPTQEEVSAPPKVP